MGLDQLSDGLLRGFFDKVGSLDSLRFRLFDSQREEIMSEVGGAVLDLASWLNSWLNSSSRPLRGIV
jgi:hypothetical protein